MIDALLDDFFVRALIAGLLLALIAAPLGCFVVWRRLAYLGDATSHAAVLGVALGLALSVSIVATVFLIAAIIALLVARNERLARGGALPSDSLLGVLSHGALAIGLVLAALLEVRLDLDAFLFGDILAVGASELALLAGGALLLAGWLIWRWSPLLLTSLDADLALASGINPHRETLTLMIALAATVALSIQLVGALLITALLIIPAATARQLASSPERMLALSLGFAVTANTLGILSSNWFDLPTGPSMVATATALFIAVAGIKTIRGRS